jgi:simple sugar transport system permease protein
MPSAFFIPLLILVGFLGGALWATIAAVLKNKFQIPEIISTLMLNFVILYFISYLLYGPWMDPVSVMPQSELFPPSARLPALISGTRSHVGSLLFILVVPLVYLILNKTVFGYEIKTMGGSLKGARYSGMNLNKIVFFVMIVGGGLAGIAGMVEASGVFYRLREDISYGYGWTAILVALLGKNHPGWVTLVSFLFGILLVGGFEMQTATGIPYALSSVTYGLIFFSVLGAEALARYKISLKG